MVMCDTTQGCHFRGVFIAKRGMGFGTVGIPGMDCPPCFVLGTFLHQHANAEPLHSIPSSLSGEHSHWVSHRERGVQGPATTLAMLPTMRLHTGICFLIVGTYVTRCRQCYVTNGWHGSCHRCIS